MAVFKKHKSFMGLYQLETVNQSRIQPQIDICGLECTINELTQLESRLIIVSAYSHRSYCLFEKRKLLFLHKIISPGTKFETLKPFLKVIDCTQQLRVRENVVGFEQALGALKVIKDQIDDDVINNFVNL